MDPTPGGNVSLLKGRVSPMKGSGSPLGGNVSPLGGKHSPLRGSSSPLKGSDSPLGGGHSPLAGSSSLLAGNCCLLEGEGCPLERDHRSRGLSRSGKAMQTAGSKDFAPPGWRSPGRRGRPQPRKESALPSAQELRRAQGELLRVLFLELVLEILDPLFQLLHTLLHVRIPPQQPLDVDLLTTLLHLER